MALPYLHIIYLLIWLIYLQFHSSHIMHKYLQITLFAIFTIKRCFACNSFWNLLTWSMEPIETSWALNHENTITIWYSAMAE
jgi:hypothetical protein